MSTKELERKRSTVIDEIKRVGREHSTATIMFHSTLAEKVGVAATDWKALDLLDRAGALTAGEIAAQTGLATGSVTSLIDRLERKRLVKRVHDDQDRRRVIVKPRENLGARFFPLMASFAKSANELFSRYSDHELETILDFLTRNATRVRGETAKLAARGEPDRGAKRGHYPFRKARP